MERHKVLSLLDNLEFYVISLGIFATVVSYIPFFITSYNLPKLIILYSAAGLLILLRILRITLTKELVLYPSDIFFLLILLSNILTFVLSDNHNLSWWGEYRQQGSGFISILVFLYIASIINRLDNIHKTLCGLFFIGATTIASLFVIKEYIIIHGRPNGLEGQPILSASIIGLGFILLLALFFLRKYLVEDRYAFLIGIPVAILHITALITLATQTVLIPLVGSLIFIYIMKYRLRISRTIFISSLFFILMLLVIIIPFIAQKKSFSIYQRVIEHNTAYNMIGNEWINKNGIKNLLLGHGQNTSVLYSRKYKLLESFHTKEWLWRISRIRDNYLELLFTTGIIGVGVWIAFFIAALHFGLKNNRLEILFIAIYLFLWQLLYYMIPLYYLAWLVVLAYHVNNSRPQVTNLKTPQLIILIVLFIVSSGYLINSVIKITYAEYLFSEGKMAQSIAVMPENSSYRKVYSDAIFQILQQYREDHPCIKARECYLNNLDTLYDRGIKELQTSIKQNQKDSESMYQLSTFYFFRHLDTPHDHYYLAQAEKYIDMALQLDPLNPEIYDSKGMFRLEVGDYQQAEFYLRKSLDIKPDLISSQNHLKEVQKQYKH